MVNILLLGVVILSVFSPPNRVVTMETGASHMGPLQYTVTIGSIHGEEPQPDYGWFAMFILGLLGLGIVIAFIMRHVIKGPVTSIPSEKTSLIPGKGLGVVKEREVVRELVKIRCAYCGKLYDERLNKCPHCGAG